VTLILASASPRRRELLERLHIPFEIVVSDVFERPPLEGEDPREYALALATAKACEISRQYPGDIVLGGDTVVVRDGEMFGKPGSEEEAVDMLFRLRGKAHEVITGVVVRCGDGEHADAEYTAVVMRDASDSEIRCYVASGEPMDKAGAYAVQGEGGALVEGIEGCLENVVGLPLCVVRRLLVECGVEVGNESDVCTHFGSSRPWSPTQ
jgi:nucleoside triphosphate pyrophosphatase